MKNSLLCLFLSISYSVFCQTFTGGSGSINDNATIDIPVAVNGLPNAVDTSNFGLETVCINLTHTYDADLTVWIVAPDGTTVLLFSNTGGADDNFTNTCFNANAAAILASGTAPYTGTFKPVGQIGLINNGQNPNGTWKLRVNDNYGGDQGNVLSFSIAFGNNPAGYFAFSSSLLPIVEINTNGNVIQNDPKVMADMKIRFNGQGIRNYMSDSPNEYNGKIGIEYRGNYSLSLPQKPYALETWDINGNAIDSSLLGMPAESDWVLLANYNDKSFARNILPFHLFDSMDHYATRMRLVDVVMNGEYQGIYLLGEKIKRDNNRVDVNKLDPTEIAGVDLTGGYILKIDYWNNNDSWLLNHSPIGFPGLDVHMVYVYPKPEDLMPQQTTYIQNFIDDYEDALYGSNFAHPSLGYRAFIDVPSFIDYFIVNEVCRNGDGFKKSRFFSKDKDKVDGTVKKMKAGPVWDFDWAEKDMWSGSEDGSQFMYGACDQDVNAPGWYIRLLEDTLFANELRCRYDDMRRSILKESYIYAKIDSVAQAVNESQVWHYQTWGHLGSATGTPEVQAPSQTYAEEVQRLKSWFQRRLEWLDINMPGTLNSCSMLGIQDLVNTHKITAYPNPFSSIITVEWSQTDLVGAQLTIRDGSGRMIKTHEITMESTTDKSLTITDLHELANGVYFIEITKGDQRAVLKIIK
ncbi:CotH kinase family protein [Fluviicola taffensis]|uniref:Spore coat protein CotH n=1 Tax=Fluviicola taffensis (strain DSM 16823 / NCIMB 13979 / RW262) TaxID=755732 RepID=F2ICY7_FLUTR|nr:CotH kinase family protein [Fluviicola taffensis]AEA43361.1 Spore coat protein CotH [Fluviicola taffensis DSM 16823]